MSTYYCIYLFSYFLLYVWYRSLKVLFSLILLYVCPHTTVCVSSSCCICVLILLYMWLSADYYTAIVLILLYTPSVLILIQHTTGLSIYKIRVLCIRLVPGAPSIQHLRELVSALLNTSAYVSIRAHVSSIRHLRELVSALLRKGNRYGGLVSAQKRCSSMATASPER